MTGGELAAVVTGENGELLGRQEVGRRLPELERAGFIKRCGPRKCSVVGSMQTTWMAIAGDPLAATETPW
jgi:hypothetical protein